MTTHHSLYSQIPATDRLLREPRIYAVVERFGHTATVEMLRLLQDEARCAIQAENSLPDWCSAWELEVEHRLDKNAQSALRPVINLTGTVLHTNLGRAQQAEEAVAAVGQAMRTPVTLEYDLDGAGRGHRDRALADLLCQLTGAEDACIVNNNAAAVLLMLAATASGKEVVVSRGELVEIGGAFRIPDVIRKSGARLVEVGTTNRTHLADYTAAINEDTAIILKVHTSNYKIIGFTATVSREELACLGNVHGIIVMEDLGSGNLMDLSSFGLPREPTVEASIAAGVDLVTFSGDKLLGGIQAGIIAGRKQLVRKIARNPLARAVRVDKLTLAALEAVLKLYRDPERIVEALPIMHMLTLEEAELQKQASMLLQAIQEAVPNHGDTHIVDVFGEVGGGTMPGTRLPGKAVAFRPYHTSVHQLQAQLRLVRAEHPEEGLMPVIVPIQDDRLIFHVRTLLSGQVKIVARALKVVLGGLAQ